jgi:predicted RNA binding protein YcfA (HicA-like mRNA interferase family)
VKRRDLIRHLLQHGCVYIREGSNHTIYANPAILRSSPIPRHRELNEKIARKFCHDLKIPPP